MNPLVMKYNPPKERRKKFSHTAKFRNLEAVVEYMPRLEKYDAYIGRRTFISGIYVLIAHGRSRWTTFEQACTALAALLRPHDMYPVINGVSYGYCRQLWLFPELVAELTPVECLEECDVED